MKFGILIYGLFLCLIMAGCERSEKNATDVGNDTKSATEKLDRGTSSVEDEIEKGIEEIEEKVEEQHEKAVKKEDEIAPERIASNLWDLIQTENYSKRWYYWPGEKEFYKGVHPHGALLTTYVNSIAVEAIENKEGEMRDGAIVVKENYNAEKDLQAITVMFKLAGFDKEHNNWFWVKYNPAGKVDTMEEDGKEIELAGTPELCVSCHKNQVLNDYLFTGSLK